ncbi:MAG TPA: hypothetical protein VJ922_06465, partial [Actinomycetota bacterium]|nr:hypothetical protein [Actinomycetota bacterium]
ACADDTPSTGTLEQYPVERRIPARDMPNPLLKAYELNGASKNSNAYYRSGTLDTEMAVYQTTHGSVYVDSGGGGMAFAIECAALTDFQKRNGWNRGSSCLEGQR